MRHLVQCAVTVLVLVGAGSGCDAPPSRKAPTKGAKVAPVTKDGSPPPVAAIVAKPLPPLEFKTEPTGAVEATPAVLSAGKALYARRCAACHGDDGRGDGSAAYLLYPKPRDFHTGPFRFASTWDGAPTDKDLYRAVSRGIPGSGMPSWAHLSEADRWSLVHHINTLSAKPLVQLAAKAPDPAEGEDGEGPIAIPKEPKDDEAGRKRGKEVFVLNCGRCHGNDGSGDGPSASTLKDSAGMPIRPRDLRTGVFKGGARAQDIYARIVGGIHGTPMPAAPALHGDDAWHVVHFVRAMSSDHLRERAEMRKYRINVVRTAKVPDHPDAGAWRAAPPTELHLMPLWWRYQRPEYLTVRAMHDGESIAVQLVWSDSTRNDKVVRPQDFRDAAAIQLTNLADPPLFAMGEKGKFVNIWMWKAERQAELKGFRDMDAEYPNIGIDSYPNLQKQPYEQPLRKAMTLDSDKTYITAWKAGNIVTDPERRKSVEDLSAQGFGTLRARPGATDDLDGFGVQGKGSRRVVFRRKLAGVGQHAVTLTPGKTTLAGFAVWDGAQGDRDGRKSVAIWQELVLAP